VNDCRVGTDRDRTRRLGFAPAGAQRQKVAELGLVPDAVRITSRPIGSRRSSSAMSAVTHEFTAPVSMIPDVRTGTGILRPSSRRR